MKHVFILDTKAFYGHEWKLDIFLDTIGEYFRTQENPDFSIQYSRYRRNATSIINDEFEKADANVIIRVYAIGDDEIFFDCLNGVALFSNMELAFIPQMKSNDFLRIFGKDKIEGFRDVMSSINADHAETLPTDVIKWGINYALNSCYIGMDSVFFKRTNKSFFFLSKILLFFNFIYSAFDKKVSARKYKILIDNEDYSGQYTLIHIANGPYFGGKMTGANNATPDDGLLNVTLIKSTHFLGTLSSLRKYSKGKQPKNSMYFRVKNVKIESDSQMWIQLDNEVIQDTSITLDVVPQAINMVVTKDLSYSKASV